jgi:phosphoribosylaminoimidazole-succinocarboxamide synthase
VRDVYESGEHLVLVTTDRQSAFDRVLASIPFKGQVCSYLSVYSVLVSMSVCQFHKTN